MNDAHPAMNALGQTVRVAHTTLPADLRGLADYERHAVHHMAAGAWQHVQAGAGLNLAVQRNRSAFDALQLLPEPLADVRQGHTRLTLLGQALQHPILLGPVAYQTLAHPEGELALVRAAMALQTGVVLSTLSSHTLEAVAQHAGQTTQAMGAEHTAPRWFQLYSQPDRAHTLSLLRRAEAAGYSAVVWTVDASFKRSDFSLPAGVVAANLRDFPRVPHSSQIGQGAIVLGTALAQQAPRWDELDWLRGQTTLPLLVKGLLSPKAALQAMARGADALIVSNHGGRVLDGVPAPIEVLPAVAQAVQGRVPLLLDSGVRQGSDVLKALALGAQAVLLGRPQMHALAVGGWLGVAHLLHLLRAELELAMVQTGCATLADIGPQVLWPTAGMAPQGPPARQG